MVYYDEVQIQFAVTNCIGSYVDRIFLANERYQRILNHRGCTRRDLEGCEINLRL